VWGGSNRLTHTLPLRIWFFADGLYVEDALAPYRSLVGARIVGVAGAPLRDVLQQLDPLIPHDNAATVQLLRPRFLLTTEVLHGLGLVESTDSVSLDIVDEQGTRRSVDIDAVETGDYNTWAGEYGLHLVARPGLLATTHPDEVLWHALLHDEHTLYVGYNQVQVLDFDEVDRITRLARSDAVDRIVVDIRRNFGGEVGEEEPLLDLLADPKLHNKRLYLLTARNTFSAGSRFAAELLERADVTVAGEPTGGAPAAYGNSTELPLVNNDLWVSVATTREFAVSRDDRRTTIEPDVAAAMTFADWYAGHDTVLEAAINDGR
jgi:hypothetical protein